MCTASALYLSMSEISKLSFNCYFLVGRNIRILSSSSIGEANPFMPLCGGYDADSHDPIYIAYDREGIHYACLEKINLV